KDWEGTQLGDSIGKWEGDTLVIDTIGFKNGDQTWLDGHGNRHSDALHVTERWRRISANQLWYEHTIDDPKFYTKPWTITGWVMPLAPKDWELLEYACTAGNKDLEGGHLQPGALDGSGRNGSAIATPPPQRGTEEPNCNKFQPRLSFGALDPLHEKFTALITFL